MTNIPKPHLRFKNFTTNAVHDIEGRFAQTLAALTAAGNQGITALEVSN